MANKKLIQAQKFQLAGSGISATATSIILKSFNDAYGNAIESGDLNTTNYGTLEPGTDREEIISFTGITSNADGTVTLTGVTRGLQAVTPYTADTSLRKSHAGSTIFILTNNPQVYQGFPGLTDDNTFTGTNTFTGSLVVPTGGTGTEAASHDDIADAVTGASGTATQAVHGTVKLSVAAASVPDPIVVGDNDPRVPTAGENNALVGNNTDIAVGTGNKFVTQTGLQKSAETYAADSVGTDSYAVTLAPVPTSLAAGMTLRIKVGTANTGAATLNVNSLGAKTIKKNYNSDLVTGDLLAGQIIEVTYDASNDCWQMLSPTVPSTAVTPEFQLISTVTVSAVSLTSGSITKIAEFTGLTGNTDDIYQIQYETVFSANVGTASHIYLRLNDSAGGSYDSRNQNFASGGLSYNANNGANQLTLIEEETGHAITHNFGQVLIKGSRTIAGTIRMISGQSTGSAENGTNTQMEVASGSWTDGTNEITSIQLYALQTSGSSKTISGKVSLYKINR